MTFSAIARCPRTGQLGVGAVTGTPGVGTLLTWALRGVGAIATQAWVNPYLGVDGLDLLDNGHPAQKALEAVIAMDDGREQRQLGIVDGKGRTAVWTGQECEEWAGHRTGDGWTVQGNMLRSGETVEACAEAVAAGVDLDLVERLIRALEAGAAAGGDKRGARSATVYVVDTEQFPLWDLRIDDDREPLLALRRLHEAFAKELLPQIRRLPTREDTLGQLTSSERTGLL